MKLIEKLFTQKSRNRAMTFLRYLINVIVIIISIGAIAAACYYNVALIAMLSDFATNYDISVVKLTGNDITLIIASLVGFIVFGFFIKRFKSNTLWVILSLLILFVDFLFILGAVINMML